MSLWIAPQCIILHQDSCLSYVLWTVDSLAMDLNSDPLNTIITDKYLLYLKTSKAYYDIKLQ